jgi:hypothetical protein
MAFWKRPLVKIALINAVILGGVFGAGEIFTRLIFPEFIGHIHSPNMTMGLQVHSGEFQGVPVRVPSPGYVYSASSPTVIILGDSISIGFGHSFEDIYWVQLWRKWELASSPIQVVTFGGYANNLKDLKVLCEKVCQTSTPIKMVIYQFNQNDVVAVGKNALHGLSKNDLFRSLAKLRYAYCNYSAFFRLFQHLGGMLLRNRSGTPEERGLDTLGPYTWAYGCRAFASDSERLWNDLETDLRTIQEDLKERQIPFVVWISPILFDIDRTGFHPFHNYLHYDFSAATIDPRQRLREICQRQSIHLIDPIVYLRENFLRREREGNFVPFFFPADDNHFAPTVSRLVADFLHSHLPQLEPR